MSVLTGRSLLLWSGERGVLASSRNVLAALIQVLARGTPHWCQLVRSWPSDSRIMLRIPETPVLTASGSSCQLPVYGKVLTEHTPNLLQPPGGWPKFRLADGLSLFMFRWVAPGAVVRI